MKDSTKKQPEPMAKKIIDYALEIIADTDIDSLTMRKLAAKMGTSAPNIYNYYKSKSELFFAIRIQGFEILHNMVKDAYESSPDPRLKVKNIINAYLSFGTRYSIYYDIIFNRPPGAAVYEDNLYTEYVKREKLIAHDIPRITRKALGELLQTKDPDVTQDQLRLLVIHTWSLIHGVIQLNNSGSHIYMSERTKGDFDRVIDDFMFSLTGIN